MEQITLRLNEDTLDEVETEAQEQGVSRSEYLREVIESRNEHAEDIEELRAEVDRLRDRVDELRDEREDLLRSDVRVDVLEDEVERLREERDEALRRAERTEQKLQLHSSEKSRLERLRDWLG